MDTFHYLSYAQEIIFGPGSLSQLKGAVERSGWQRVLLCTSHSMRAGGQAALVEEALDGCVAAKYEPVQPHVRDVQVREAVELARKYQAQAILGLGGGSPIGLAKAASFALEEHPATPTTQPRVPVIAIPTTYAGSEMTAVCGVTHTDETPQRKVTLSDPRIAPKLILYDPRLTLDLPRELTASTGMNAVAHCVEALYSITRNPLSSAAAVEGLRRITHALPGCLQDGGDLAARGEMLLGAHLAGLALSNVKMGLHHGLCHVLGGTLNIPHGVANSIMLPYSIRFNAEAVAPELLQAAHAAGVGSVEAFVDQLFQLAHQAGLPQRLRDVDVQENDLPRLARLGFESKTIHNNPRPITGADQLESLLRAAW
jgi:maleylacetate reductase